MSGSLFRIRIRIHKLLSTDPIRIRTGSTTLAFSHGFWSGFFLSGFCPYLDWWGGGGQSLTNETGSETLVFIVDYIFEKMDKWDTVLKKPNLDAWSIYRARYSHFTFIAVWWIWLEQFVRIRAGPTFKLVRIRILIWIRIRILRSKVKD